MLGLFLEQHLMCESVCVLGGGGENRNYCRMRASQLLIMLTCAARTRSISARTLFHVRYAVVLHQRSPSNLTSCRNIAPNKTENPIVSVLRIRNTGLLCMYKE
jgi:hypothetical protein